MHVLVAILGVRGIEKASAARRLSCRMKWFLTPGRKYFALIIFLPPCFSRLAYSCPPSFTLFVLFGPLFGLPSPGLPAVLEHIPSSPRWRVLARVDRIPLLSKWSTVLIAGRPSAARSIWNDISQAVSSHVPVLQLGLLPITDRLGLLATDTNVKPHRCVACQLSFTRR